MSTFFTPNPYVSGNDVVEKSFHGVANFVANNWNSPFYPLMKIYLKSLNNSLVTVETWTVAEGANRQLFANMRHVATHHRQKFLANEQM